MFDPSRDSPYVQKLLQGGSKGQQPQPSPYDDRRQVIEAINATEPLPERHRRPR